MTKSESSCDFGVCVEPRTSILVARNGAVRRVCYAHLELLHRLLGRAVRWVSST